MLSRLRSLFVRERGEHPETRERQKEAAVSSHNKAGTRKWSWVRHKAPTELSSQPTLLTKKQVKKEIERMTTELQLMTNQRNELRDRLLFISEGTVDNRPYHKPNPFYEKLKLEHKQVLWELKVFEKEKTEVSEKFSELKKETVFYRGLHSRLLMEESQLHKKVDMLRQEKRKLHDDWVLLKHHLEDLNVTDQDEESSDMKIQQQELKRLKERLEVLLKQKEMFFQHKDLAETMQHHFDVSQMRSTELQPQLEQDTAQDESHLQKDVLQQEPPAEPNIQQILNSSDATEEFPHSS
ncbi:disks large homolog 5-like [Mesocricetus auratus]|uniref:Disks large homolog 5-like n=2 Tax=Mesocricetus auratus TaxID=10036 RepID=A0ABM2Y8D3_MESAU|nr:disks large homolog 5-like [Mesocricetus auratus]